MEEMMEIEYVQEEDLQPVTTSKIKSNLVLSLPIAEQGISDTFEIATNSISNDIVMFKYGGVVFPVSKEVLKEGLNRLDNFILEEKKQGYRK